MQSLMMVLALLTPLVSAQKKCINALRFKKDSNGNATYVLDIHVNSGVGKYTLTAFGKYSYNYDGEKFFMRTEWYDDKDNLRSKQNNYFDSKSWPTKPNEYQFIHEIVNTAKADGGFAPSRVRWLVGYPAQNTKGEKRITSLSMKGPNGKTYVVDSKGNPDGDFAGGHPSDYNPSASQGPYEIVEDCPGEDNRVPYLSCDAHGW